MDAQLPATLRGKKAMPHKGGQNKWGGYGRARGCLKLDDSNPVPYLAKLIQDNIRHSHKIGMT